jgi:hypothetical protein
MHGPRACSKSVISARDSALHSRPATLMITSPDTTSPLCTHVHARARQSRVALHAPLICANRCVCLSHLQHAKNTRACVACIIGLVLHSSACTAHTLSAHPPGLILLTTHALWDLEFLYVKPKDSRFLDDPVCACAIETSSCRHSLYLACLARHGCLECVTDLVYSPIVRKCAHKTYVANPLSPASW